MKKTNFWIVLVLLSITTILSACSKDDDADAREIFEGTWRATENFVFDGAPFSDTYTFTITKSSGSEKNILLTGFAAEPSESITASVDGNSFVIPQQTIISNGESVGVSGSGSISDNTITYSYNASFIDASINVSGTASKL
ncbi:MAG: hypothetical protein ACLFQS_02985 [Bacteroidales bacterium]